MSINSVLSGEARWALIEGDCLDVLRAMPDESVDAVITDPPYGLGNHEPTVDEIIAYLQGSDLDTGGDFMGKRWLVPSVAIWREVKRVCKPGAHVLCFGGTRTFDLISLGLRAAGFENRDTISDEGVLRWTYGSGFPKSLDVSKAIEAHVITGKSDSTRTATGEARDREGLHWSEFPAGKRPAQPQRSVTTDEAKKWSGWFTALKPSWEPVLVFRRPLVGTVAANVLQHGTGALNVDACRVGSFVNETPSGADRFNARNAELGYRPGTYQQGASVPEPKEGRWPANLVLSHKSSLWYALRADTSEDTVAAIHSYYGVEQALRTLRQGDPRDAVGASQATLLLPGVRWAESQGQAQDGMGDVDVRGLRGTVQGDSRMGEKRASEILLEGLPRQGDGWQEDATRETSPSGVEGQDGVGGARALRAREVVAVEGREVHGSCGLLARHGSDAAACVAEPGAPDDGHEPGLHPGAPSGDGGETRPQPSPDGTCASRRRGQGQQPTGQPVPGGSEGPQHQASRGREGTDLAQGRGGEAPRGKPRLEVEGWAVPDGWIELFVPAAVDECRCVGTKRIKPLEGFRPNPVGVQADGQIKFTDKPVGYQKGSYTDADGKETVEAWSCSPDCPVRLLDEQSGDGQHLHNPDVKNGGNHDFSGCSSYPGSGVVTSRYFDGGGASRFFPTFAFDEPGFLYTAKAAKSERNLGLGTTVLMKMRDDLSDQEKEFVFNELRQSGVCL